MITFGRKKRKQRIEMKKRVSMRKSKSKGEEEKGWEDGEGLFRMTRVMNKE